MKLQFCILKRSSYSISIFILQIKIQLCIDHSKSLFMLFCVSLGFSSDLGSNCGVDVKMKPKGLNY